MATMTIRNLDEDVKTRLRLRAALHGRSMEEEVRSILRSVLSGGAETHTGAALVDDIRALVEPFGGIELPELERDPMREPIDFGDSSR